MERIGFLINKLREQYEKADSNEGMLVTLQMLYRELLPKMYGSPSLGKVSVVVPGQMDLSFLEQNLEEKISIDLTPNSDGRQVFELSAVPTENAKRIEILPIAEAKPIAPTENVKPSEAQPIEETKPTAPVENVKPIENQPIVEANSIYKPFVAVEPPKNPFIITASKVEVPVSKPEPIITEKKEEKPREQSPEISKDDFFEAVNSRFLPQVEKPIVQAPVVEAPIIPVSPAPLPPPPVEPKTIAAAVPPKELHETILNNVQPSLNDKAEKRQPELFHVLKAEPLKDLKKAISINERFQYINHLFMKDETMYDRSLKTINSFNVISEAKFWIRKELAIKMGWSDDDEVVQQFMHLVERRFL